MWRSGLSHRGLLAAPWSFRGIQFLQICKLARANYQASMLQSCFLKVQLSSVTQLCPTLCNPMNHSMPRPPCPSPTPGVHSNSCPWSRWCHQAKTLQLWPKPVPRFATRLWNLWSIPMSSRQTLIITESVSSSRFLCLSETYDQRSTVVFCLGKNNTMCSEFSLSSHLQCLCNWRSALKLISAKNNPIYIWMKWRWKKSRPHLVTS